MAIADNISGFVAIIVLSYDGTPMTGGCCWVCPGNGKPNRATVEADGGAGGRSLNGKVDVVRESVWCLKGVKRLRRQIGTNFLPDGESLSSLSYYHSVDTEDPAFHHQKTKINPVC